MHLHRTRPLIAALAGMVAVAPAATGQEPTRRETTRDTITAFYQTWRAATAAEGATGYAKFFAPAARLVPPGDSMIVGRDSIRVWMERRQRDETATTQSDSVSQDEVTIVGSFAMVVTSVRGRRVPEEGGPPVQVETRYVDILERTPSGWMLVYRSWAEKTP